MESGFFPHEQAPQYVPSPDFASSGHAQHDLTLRSNVGSSTRLPPNPLATDLTNPRPVCHEFLTLAQAKGRFRSVEMMSDVRLTRLYERERSPESPLSSSMSFRSFR